MTRRLVIYFTVFVAGAILMGFEMLGSRYLYPHFGGSINTWAVLISTVLYALTAGYFVGGVLIDRFPSTSLMSAAVGLAGLYMAAIPALAEASLEAIVSHFGVGLIGMLTASALLLFVPVALLGTLTPVAVRLILHDPKDSGRVAGLVYGISTVGSVFGTLFTTFQLIPTFGSRLNTYIFAVSLIGLGLLVRAALPRHSTYS
jgi:hypothetical protein